MLRTFTEAVTRFLPSEFKDRIRAATADVFRLNHGLTSGVQVTVARPADFATYSEIFVDGFYDRALLDAIRSERARRELRLLDLGSNVGYFGLRAADLVARHAHDLPLNVTMVEGTKAVAEESRRRLSPNVSRFAHWEVIHGLVGKRDGFADISTEYNYGYNSIVGPSNGKRRERVAFFDLTALLSAGPFDLIKCDIEGAEEQFLETYGPMLGGHPRIVFELHHQMCDTARCHRVLEGQGFRASTIFANADISMAYYHRA